MPRRKAQTLQFTSHEALARAEAKAHAEASLEERIARVEAIRQAWFALQGRAVPEELTRGHKTPR